MEVFQLPYMITTAEATSRAVWDFVQQHDRKVYVTGTHEILVTAVAIP